MGGLKAVGAVSALCLMLSLGGAVVPAQAEQPGAWAERVQIVYQAETRSVVRKTVRVWDPAPEKNLDFIWEPAAGQPSDGVAEDGAIQGTGRLVWRVRGSASYDPATVYSSYSGALKNGRPNGKGRLEIRSGEVFDGNWVDGELTGAGLWIDAAGNRYEGDFKAGRPDGQGRYMATNGEIFTGTFAAGLRHGEGRTMMAGGTTYESTWVAGRETGGTRPDVLADALVGGLIKAQSGGGDAGKVEIGVTVDERMNQQSEMQYQHLVREGDIAIYPTSDDLNNYWNGTGSIAPGDYSFSGIDWEQSPAFVEVGLETGDGSRVKLDKLELQVAASDTYNKPMLTLTEHNGCVGFRPSFSFVNHGWGQVRDAKISVQFTGQTDYSAPDPDAPKSRVFERKIADFDQGADVTVKDILDEAGVDTGKLETKRYSCQSMDSLNVCRSQVFNDVGFGEVADFVWGEDQLFTTMTGKLDYSWADDQGNVYQQSEPFQASLSLAVIEVPKELAECGDGFGGSPEAARYQDVKLQLGQRDYVVDMPMRGNKSISKYTARLKMSAEKSSFHTFKVAAHFADGSTRDSKPVSLFYFRPRPAAFSSTAMPSGCYITETPGGC